MAAAEGKVFIIVAIMKFLRGHVFVYESLYLHYLRMNVPTFFVATSSPHEVSMMCNFSVYFHLSHSVSLTYFSDRAQILG